MAIISSYEPDGNLSIEDLLVGSNYIGTVNGVKQYNTRAYSLGALSAFFALNTEIDGEIYDISKISSRVDNLQDMFTYGEGDTDLIGEISGLSTTLLGYLNTWGDARFGSTAFQDQLDDHITFDGQGNISSMSEAFANFVVTTTASDRFAESSVVTNLSSTVTTINTELGSAQTAISNAQESINTQSTAISAAASKITSLGASFGTFDGDSFSLSTSTMTSIVDSLTLENYASTSSVTTLTSTVNQKPNIYRQDAAPSTDVPVGSLWFDTDDENKLYVLVAGDPNVWTVTTDQSAANIPSIFRQDDEPTTAGVAEGSLWFDTNDNNKLYVFSSDTWQSTDDTRIAANATTISSLSDDLDAAVDDIADNVSAIGLKPNVYRQDDAPTGTIPALSIWYDTNDNNKAYAYVNSEWVSVEDTRVGGLVTSVATAEDNISTLTTDTQALSNKTTELESQFTFDGTDITGVTGALNTSISNAASTAAGSVASDLDKLEAVFSFDTNGDVDGISGALSSAVTTHATTAITNADLAAAADVTELKTQYTFDVDGNITGTADTLAAEITTAQSDAESASATKIGLLAAEFFTGYDTADGSYTDVSLSTAVQTAISDVVSSDGYAAASDLETLEVKVEGTDGTGGLTGSVTTLQSTVASKPEVFRQDAAPATTEPVGSLWFDTDDNNKAYILVSGDPNVWTETTDARVADVLDFVESSYSLATDANGVVTGMELYSRSSSNTTISEVKFTADSFIIKSSTTEATPFILDGTSLKLNVPLNGVSGSFSGDISAATGTFGGSLNVNDNFLVSSSGSVQILGGDTLGDARFEILDDNSNSKFRLYGGGINMNSWTGTGALSGGQIQFGGVAHMYSGNGTTTTSNHHMTLDVYGGSKKLFLKADELRIRKSTTDGGSHTTIIEGDLEVQGDVSFTSSSSHPDTSSVTDSSNTGLTFIQNLDFDAYGHVQSYTTATVSSPTTPAIYVDGQGDPQLTAGVTDAEVRNLLNVPTAYTLPTATATTLGGVKIGSGISITSGVISADDQTSGLATLADPTFTGTPAAPTAAAGTNTTQIATTAFVQTAVSDLVDSSPAALDTLNELAAALGDDANFSTTVNTALGNRVRVDTATQGLTDQEKLNARTNIGAVAFGHSHSASDITGGTLDADRLPQTITGLDILTADKLKGELKTVTLDAQSEVPLDLTTYTNIYCDIGINGWRGFDLTIDATAVGNSGTIILHNGAQMTVGAPFNMPSEFKTPNGDSIVWVRGSGTTAILSYFVVSTSVVLINYIGNYQ